MLEGLESFAPGAAAGAALAGSAMFAWRKRKTRQRDALLPDLHGRIDVGDDGVWRWGLRSGDLSVARSQVQGWPTQPEALAVFTVLFPGVPYETRSRDAR